MAVSRADHLCYQAATPSRKESAKAAAMHSAACRNDPVLEPQTDQLDAGEHELDFVPYS